MKKGMIITCPDYDDVTKIFFEYSKEIKDFAKQKGIELKELNREDVNANNFGKVLSKLNYSFVFINGHGSETEVAGNKNEIILSNKINFKEFGKRICYCRSCESAKKLGVNVVKNGGTFIGYNKPFKFYCAEKDINNPLNDRTAKLFLDPSNVVTKVIIKGKSAGEANNRGKKAILKSINKVLQDESYGLQVAVDLWNNHNSQVIHGDENLKISDEF